MELNLLALETSSSRCGVALLRETPQGPQVSVLEHEGAQEHAERLLPMAGELLARAGLVPADLHAVAFGQGPGGFTGLRVACGVAQGMGLALDIPVLPVVSHLAVAEQAAAAPGEIVLVALDARMSEVYLAAYVRPAGSDWQVVQAPMLIAADEAVAWAGHHLPAWSAAAGSAAAPLAAGDAWDIYPDDMRLPPAWRRAPAARPEAAAVARLARLAWQRGEAVAPELAAPLYVRDKVAFTTLERELGQGGNPRAAPALGAPVLAPMTAADLDEVVALEAELQAFPWTRGNFADALASGYEGRVLRQDGRLAGFCVLMLAPDVAHLLVIAVARAHHRQGLGSRLMEWCEQCARDHGLPGILLEVRPSNQTALAFYERQGFLRIGVRKGYYPAGRGQREDALVMQKNLARDGARP